VGIRAEISGRIFYLDLLRVVASFAVVLLHEVPWQVTHLPADSLGWWTANIYNIGMRFCVPVFIMISGALLLDPGRAEPVATFFRKRLFKVVIPFLVWVCFYYGFYLYRAGDPFVAEDFVREAARTAGSPHMPHHLWFLPMLIGLYLATPFIRPFTDRATPRDLTFFVGLCALLASGFPMLERFADVEVSLGNGMFNIYLGYFVLGALLHRLPCPSGHQIAGIFAPLALAALAAGAVGAHALYRELGSGYDGILNRWFAPNVVILSLCTFLTIRYLASTLPLRHPAVERAVAWLAPLSFGIYLVHIAVITLLEPISPFFGYFGDVAGMPLRALSAFVVSVLVVVVLRRVPLLRATVP